MTPPPENEPDWDEHYRSENTPWNKGSAAPPLLEWIGKNPDSIGGRILVPGCGFGHDVRALAALSKVSEVVGLDLAPTAIAQASAIPGTGKERFSLGNLFSLSSEHIGSYDWVWEHTCFCAIDPAMRASYARSVHAALRSDGIFLGVFYRNPYDSEHQPGDRPPHGCTLEELDQLFVQSGLFHIDESYVPSASYPGREGLEQVIRMRPR